MSSLCKLSHIVYLFFIQTNVRRPCSRSSDAIQERPQRAEALPFNQVTEEILTQVYATSECALNLPS